MLCRKHLDALANSRRNRRRIMLVINVEDIIIKRNANRARHQAGTSTISGDLPAHFEFAVNRPLKNIGFGICK